MIRVGSRQSAVGSWPLVVTHPKMARLTSCLLLTAYCLLLSGCGVSAPLPTAKTPAPKKVLPEVKVALLKYHQAKFLRTEARSAPRLDAKNHPHGWTKADCLSCHEMAKDANIKDCTRCHGSNGLTPQPDNCQTCHRVTNPEGAPDDGVHLTHMRTVTRKVECLNCHPAQTGDSHANGHLDIQMEEAKYTPVVVAAASLPGNGEGGHGSCSESSCHEAREWNVKACANCHGYPPKTGSHLIHMVRDGVIRQDMACELCHQGYKHQNGTVTIAGFDQYDRLTGTCEATCHETFYLAPSRFSPANGEERVAKVIEKKQKWGCADCHDFPPKTGNHPVKGHQEGCGTCHATHVHSDAVAKSPKTFMKERVEVALSGGGTFENGLCAGSCHEAVTWGESCSECHGFPPKTGNHLVHVQKAGMRCKDCHEGNVHDLDKDTGFIEVSDKLGFNSAKGTCVSAKGCHQDNLLNKDGAVAWDCSSCHNFPPTDKVHPAHAKPTGRYWNLDEVAKRANRPALAEEGVTCDVCHNGHTHSAKAAVAPKDFSDVHVSLMAGNFLENNQRCQMACHEPFSWKEPCTSCHPTPPLTGDHPAHFVDRPNQEGVAQEKVTCQSCHGDIHHDRQLDSPPGYYSPEGVVNVAGIDQMTGMCQSACHLMDDGKQKTLHWNCASCHGTPPATGAHSEHQDLTIDCRICHSDHVHNATAVIEPIQFSAARASFTLGGSFDKQARSCTNIGCHRNDLWLTKAERTIHRPR